MFLGFIHLHIDFDLRNQKTKKECKETTGNNISLKYWYLQNCLTPFITPGFDTGFHYNTNKIFRALVILRSAMI